jgi:hypothetical protein
MSKALHDRLVVISYEGPIANYAFNDIWLLKVPIEETSNTPRFFV